MASLSDNGHREFLRLFLANEREVLRYVLAIVPSLADAQDIVQQTAAALWEKFGLYDRSRPFAPWACRFARIETLRWLKTQKRWRCLLAEGLAEELATRHEARTPEDEARFLRLERCLGKLPDGHRELVAGYYYRRETVELLARARGRTVEAVYKTLQRARQALLDCIRRESAMEGATS